jgi:hypothetical protein
MILTNLLTLLALVWAGDMQQPHTGGPDSQSASMVIVEFAAITEGKVFKEMVQDL